MCADSAARMTMGGEKWFWELELDLPLKHTRWDLYKNPASIDFVELSGTQSVWKSWQSVASREPSLLCLYEYWGLLSRTVCLYIGSFQSL